MDITPIKKNLAKPLVNSENLSAQPVETVVQEYMDSMLVDLFPEIPTIADASESHEHSTVANEFVLEETIAVKNTVQVLPQKTARQEPIPIHSKLRQISAATLPVTDETNLADTQSKPRPNDSPKPQSSLVSLSDEAVSEIEKPALSVTAHSEKSQAAPQKMQPSTLIVSAEKVTSTAEIRSELPLPTSDVSLKNDVSVIDALAIKKTEVLRYPQAPIWAQQSFDVLLFNVCGLKLAVPMESLGRIIKVEHETSQLIGRPDWFMGAYNEHEHHFYVVDTAKYIMPEKGFNQTITGFEYLIQLQRSKWTLACQAVHTTVRLEPEQIKWRSSHSTRQWLAGTVIEHMCALIHVDSLIELLEKQG